MLQTTSLCHMSNLPACKAEIAYCVLAYQICCFYIWLNFHQKRKAYRFGGGLVLTCQNLVWTFPHVWGNCVSINCSKALTGSYVCSQVINADQEVDVLHQDILSRAMSVIENSKTKSLGYLW